MLRNILVIVVLAFVCTTSAQTQTLEWERLPGLRWVNIHGFLEHSSGTLLAYSDNRYGEEDAPTLFRRSPGNTLWERIPQQKPLLNRETIKRFVPPFFMEDTNGDIYANGDTAILLSKDTGRTWVPFFDHQVSHMTKKGEVFACIFPKYYNRDSTQVDTLFVSLEDGKSWHAAPLWIESYQSVHNMFFDDNRTLYMYYRGSLLRSDSYNNDNIIWDTLRYDRHGSNAWLDESGRIHVREIDSIFISDDWGNTWTCQNAESRHVLDMVMTADGELYGFEDLYPDNQPERLMRLQRGSDTWEPAPGNFFVNSDRRLFTSNNWYRSTNGRLEMLDVSTGQRSDITANMSLYTLNFYYNENNFALHPSGALFFQLRYPLMTTADETQWDSLAFGAKQTFLTDDGTAYFRHSGGVIVRSKDLGETTDTIPRPVKDFTVTGITLDPDGGLYTYGYGAGLGYATFRTTDNGATWDSLYSSYSHIQSCLALTSEHYLCLAQNRLLETTDGAASWNQIFDFDNRMSLDNCIPAAFTTRDGMLFLIERNGSWILTQDPGIDTVTVMRFTYNNTTPLLYDAVVDDNDVIYLATSIGAFRSIDHGITWKPINLGFEYGYVYNLLYDKASGRLYAAALDGLYKTKHSVLSAPAVAIPSSLTLEQNYPNPFNPATTVTYSLPARMHASLTVSNALGKPVQTLVDAMMDPGTHRVEFDASGLPSGSYLYTLRTESGAISRWMAVVK